MPRRSRDLLKKYLESRRKSLQERPRLFKGFIDKLTKELGDRITVILFGGRTKASLESTEPRDYDILVVINDHEDPEEIEETIYRLKPKKIPIDIIIARKSELKNTITRQMLKERIILHDALNIEKELTN